MPKEVKCLWAEINQLLNDPNNRIRFLTFVSLRLCRWLFWRRLRPPVSYLKLRQLCKTNLSPCNYVPLPRARYFIAVFVLLESSMTLALLLICCISNFTGGLISWCLSEACGRRELVFMGCSGDISAQRALFLTPEPSKLFFSACTVKMMVCCVNLF